MAWTITVQLDDDKPDVGSVTAIFTDDVDGSAFSFAERLQVRKLDTDDFVAKATAARKEWAARKDTQETAKRTLNDAFAALGETVKA